MSKITIFLPVSRDHHLERLFASLELLECNKDRTNLFVYVDGSTDLFVKARNFCEQSKFAQRLCHQRPKGSPIREHSTTDRRRRIATIKNESKQYLEACDFVFGLEDDTIIPSNTLKTLLRDYSKYPHAGFIQGVELGRWGIPYIGGWKVDDVYDPSRITSIKKGEGIEEIDAGGFYCYLTRYANYISHEYTSFDNDTLGPDFNFGLSLRQEGQKNYIDWSIRCEHRLKNGSVVTLANTEPAQVKLERRQIKTLRGNIINNWKQHVIVN